jgi:hypothetical protein
MTETQTEFCKRMIDNDSLLTHFESGVMSVSEMRGYYKGTIIKYLSKYQETRYSQDLDKAVAYIMRYKDYEAKIKSQTEESHPEPEPQTGSVVIKQGDEDGTN